MFLRIFLLFSFLGISSSVYAQEVIGFDSIENITVTTHSKLPTQIDQSSKNILIIDQEILSSNRFSNLAELLNQQLGIIVNGAVSNPSLNKSVYIQGGASENVLFLIDGSPINDPTAIGGSFDIRNLSLSSIERIEILKGAQSTLYGSNAVSGVINIITKPSLESDGTKLSGISTYGSFYTASHSIQFGIRHSNISLNIQGDYSESDGISEAQDPLSSDLFDRDGFNKKSLNAQLSIQAGKNFKISPFIRLNSFNSSFDAGAFTDSGDRYESQYSSTGINADYQSNAHNAKFLYSFTNTDRVFDTSFGLSPFKGKHHNIDLFDRYSLSKRVKVTYGFNYQRYQMIDEFASSPNPSEHITSPYVNVHLSPTLPINFDIGYRYNTHSRYGNNSTYEISGSYWLNSSIKIYSSYGSAFKAPLLPQLFGAFGANPDLLPETAESIQLGFNWEFGSSTLGVNYFYRDIKDIITFISDPITFESQYVNLNQQKDQGIEVFLGVRLLEKLKINFQYAHLQGSTLSDTGSTLSDFLIRRPKHRINTQIDYSISDHLNCTVVWDNIGQRRDLFFNFDTFMTEQIDLSNSNLFHLALSFRHSENLTFFSKVNNLFNQDYIEVFGYNNQPRNLTVGINWMMN